MIVVGMIFEKFNTSSLFFFAPFMYSYLIWRFIHNFLLKSLVFLFCLSGGGRCVHEIITFICGAFIILAIQTVH